MKATHASTLILSLMATQAFAAKQEAAAGYYIDTSFTVRKTAEITKDNAAGKLNEYAHIPMKVSEVEGKPDWRKITSPSGNFAYVHKDALVRVDVATNYKIRKKSPTSNENIGMTAKKNEGLVFTGQMKTVKDKKGAESKWLEVWNNGEKGWIAAESSKAAAEKAAARTSKPVKVAAQTAPVAKPAKAADTAPKARPAVAQAPATKPADASKVRPVVAAAEPKSKVTEPAPKAPASECVNTDQQFQTNDRLKKAYGGSTPFTNWDGSYGIKIRPTGQLWEVTIPDYVLTTKGLNPDLKKANVALKICVNASNKPYIHVYNKDFDFKDGGTNEVTITHPAAPGNPITFQRASR